MASTLSETDDWEDLIEVPDDGDEAMAGSITPAIGVVASRTRHLRGRVVAIEGALSTPRTVTHVLPLRAMAIVGNVVGDARWTRNDLDDVLFGFTGGMLVVDLHRYIDTAERIVRVSARVDVRTSSGTDRFRMSMHGQRAVQNTPITDPRLSRTFSHGSVYAGEGVGGEQTLEIAPAEPISARGVYLMLRASMITNPVGDQLLVLSVDTTHTGL